MATRPAKRPKVPSAQLDQREKDDYLPGNIIEIVIHNFMTYDHLVCKPGSRLNLVIGPNGSGKSSIVCAIALGLAGEPQLLGRASSVGAFVKRGEDSGYVKITLRGFTSEDNTTILRKIDTNNKSEWVLNGSVVPKRDLIEVIQKFNIQVNNLTQFLPQDRVCEFAKLTPVQLLQETVKAVGNPQLQVQHHSLVEKRGELKDLEVSVAKNQETMNQLKALNVQQEKDVERLPWWTLVLLCLSKRVHSIFMLRLFNDCVAMALLHAALALLLYQKWHSALIVFSAAVSVKMNVLLFAPPLVLLMLKALSIKGILSTLSCAALIQVLLGLPFLLSHPMSYISRAFNLGRVFIHFWSVNFKFVPEDIFISKEFACSLLVIHLTLLLVFSHFKWCKNEGGLLNLMRSRVHDATSKLSNIHQFTSCKPRVHILHKQHIATVMFVGNFIGIICARSLHYQFYSWYFFSLPYLLWKTPFPTIIRMLLFAGVELCWNVYPSSSCSSLLLLFIHIIILWGLWISPIEHPYVGEESHSKG
ncbi:hypothetical protein HPP92_016892 [Vanilla planifolia]|uniref:dolichyl-P-Man:Man5GlcNAc2-PP-dolichol alpha-1,3-mannosyltransferase n=1 Tax=Vanilla planifolia TaxID=51239 RepID=A0A835QJR0_VANPL|nr:hypothetical protein HPP92_016892 [Vanilla planifolia]